jgi:protein-tyrosine phosphatase
MFDALFNKHIFGKNDMPKKNTLSVDVHAHLLPRLDDGPVDIEQSVEIIKEMYAMGYRKIIMTPHIMSGYYKNSTEDILQSVFVLKSILKRRNIGVELEAAAEYYLEEELFDLIEKKEVLTFGGNKKYLLFEASFITHPSFLIESVIRIKQAGYTPVLAHPERYVNLNNLATLHRLVFNGALFQINIGSLTGYYSKQAQELAELLINNKLVAFLGTDCHSLAQLANIKSAFKLRTYQDVISQNLLNDSLLENKSSVFA